MKIALVSAYMLESVIPLARYLAKEEVDVYLYPVMPKYNQNLYVVDFRDNRQQNGFVNKDVAAKQMGGALCSYLSGVDTNFFVFPAGTGKRTILSDIYYAWKLAQHLKESKFDVINLVHSCGRFSLALVYFLRSERVTQTLHEVTGHSGKTDWYNTRLLKKLISTSIPTIFHSLVSMERFLEFRQKQTSDRYKKDLYTVIRFGLYETYTLHLPLPVVIGNKDVVDATVPIVLHLGRVVPYKGIDILIDAIKLVQKSQKVRLIVAGEGDAYFSFDGVEDYQFMNHSLTNEELVTLVKQCTLVICPYKSASQSGIPVTVYPFKKVIIASNTGGFKEIIDEGQTGLIVNDISAGSFAGAIERLLTNEALRTKMEQNIESKFRAGEFSWQYIASQTKKNYGQTMQR